MCEFCGLPGVNNLRDAHHHDFKGFFSADLIEAAVKQANANRKKQQQTDGEVDDSDDDTDGT